ncbi:hypothetical protein SDC9_137116 [bioreactor metagenome]|uniref:Uncharacterized protein n=1 Tax=bioreactor metagenome TaxID=1076179 RepID=A0A645DKN2_9ZZZZ
MAFEATKKEWSELYTFFRLLATGVVHMGTPQGKKDDEKKLSIAMINAKSTTAPVAITSKERKYMWWVKRWMLVSQERILPLWPILFWMQ